MYTYGTLMFFIFCFAALLFLWLRNFFSFVWAVKNPLPIEERPELYLVPSEAPRSGMAIPIARGVSKIYQGDESHGFEALCAAADYHGYEALVYLEVVYIKHEEDGWLLSPFDWRDFDLGSERAALRCLREVRRTDPTQTVAWFVEEGGYKDVINSV